MRRTLLRLVLVTAILAIAVAGLEIMLRVARPAVAYQYAPQTIVMEHFAASDDLPFTLKRNFHGRFRMLEFDTAVTTNSLGLRDREVDFSKPRILCLGDSFTFGFGVENDETFCAQLEASFGGRYDVINAGFAGGSSPDAYALWLSRHFDELRPQLIICNVFQNDFTDVQGHVWEPDGDTLPRRITKPGSLVTSDGALLRDNRVARLTPALRTLLKESYVVAILRDRWLKDVGEAAAAEVTTPPPPAAPAAPVAAAPTLADRRFTRALTFLREAARGTPVVIHLIPFKAQTTDSHMDDVVKAFAAAERWPVVQEYGALAPGDYFEQDGHWIAAGHAKAARYLHLSLERLGY